VKKVGGRSFGDSHWDWGQWAHLGICERSAAAADPVRFILVLLSRSLLFLNE